MKNNRQYLVVGLFVVLTGCILLTVWLWFSSTKHKPYNIYLAVFNEPVDGINVDSVIKYNGVEVGKVKQLQLDSKNPRNVFVYLNILQNIPLNKNTVATLKPQGVTGLSYVDLRLPNDAKIDDNIIPHNEPPYPQVQTQPSFLYSLSEQAQSLADNVKDVSIQFKYMLNDKNINHISNILNNLDRISDSIAKHSDQIGKSIDTLAVILDNVKSNTENLNKTMQDFSKLTVEISKTTHNVDDLLSNIQDNTLQNINAILLPNLNQTIYHLDQTSSELEQFMSMLNQNPSMLIRGKAPAKPGPGE